MTRLLPALVAVFTLSAQDRPDAAAQTAIIQRVHEQASQYVRSLPNFICTQITKRQQDGSGKGEHWKTIDTLEEQLSFFNRKETYRVVSVNGHPPGKTTHDNMSNLRSSGEFGTSLDRIFRDSSAAEFQWERRDTVGSHAVDVISYRVATANSKYSVTRNKDKATVGYHGLLYADTGTASVLRLTAEIEAPPNFPVQKGGSEVEYDIIVISGQEYLLPVKSTTYVQTGKVIDRNILEFTRYQKYDAAAVIKYDTGK